MRSRLLTIIAMAALLAVCGFVVAYRADAKDTKKTVNFTLKDVNGKTVKLSQYRGKVVVVDVWATWCGYCVREIPGLIALQDEATKQKLPLQIIGVSVDTDKAAVKKFANEKKINYPILYGDDKALKPFGQIYGLPTKFIVGKDGMVVDKIIGAIEKDDLQKRLQKYLK